MTRRVVLASGRELRAVFESKGKQVAGKDAFPPRLAGIVERISAGSYLIVLTPALDGHDDDAADPYPAATGLPAVFEISPDALSVTPRPVIPVAALGAVPPALRPHYECDAADATMIRFSPSPVSVTGASPLHSFNAPPTCSSRMYSGRRAPSTPRAASCSACGAEWAARASWCPRRRLAGSSRSSTRSRPTHSWLPRRRCPPLLLMLLLLLTLGCRCRRVLRRPLQRCRLLMAPVEAFRRMYHSTKCKYCTSRPPSLEVRRTIRSTARALILTYSAQVTVPLAAEGTCKFIHGD